MSARESGDGAFQAERSGPLHDVPPAVATPLRPAPPLAKRLNRNALTVAAALAGLTVITVLVVTRPARPSAAGASQAASNQAPPVPARPAFLDAPPKPLPASPADTARGEIGPAQAEGRASQAGSTSGVSGATPSGSNALIDARMQLPAPPPLNDAPSLSQPSSVVGGVQPLAASPRHLAYEAALVSSVFVEAHAAHAHPSPSEAASGDAAVMGIPAGLVMPQALSATSPPPPSAFDGASANGTSREPSSVAAPNAAAAAPSTPASGIAVRLDSAGSPYTVRAGTVIPGLLVTGVNSDLPGEVLGQTSRDVYDSRTESILLVPQGSRLIGTYDNRSVGTGRLIVSWTRLILPDGRSMVLPRLAGTDAQGQAGLHDEVDHHYGRVYGAALLTSALTAGVQLSQPQQSSLYAAPSTRQVAAGALGQTMGDIALEGARRGLDIPPTIVVRPGQPFNVFLAGDLAFTGPYKAAVVAEGR
jgi:type IV secretory pathway VirB10-like protein